MAGVRKQDSRHASFRDSHDFPHMTAQKQATPPSHVSEQNVKYTLPHWTPPHAPSPTPANPSIPPRMKRGWRPLHPCKQVMSRDTPSTFVPSLLPSGMDAWQPRVFLLRRPLTTTHSPHREHETPHAIASIPGRRLVPRAGRIGKSCTPSHPPFPPRDLQPALPHDGVLTAGVCTLGGRRVRW